MVPELLPAELPWLEMQHGSKLVHGFTANQCHRQDVALGADHVLDLVAQPCQVLFLVVARIRFDILEPHFRDGSRHSADPFVQVFLGFLCAQMNCMLLYKGEPSNRKNGTHPEVCRHKACIARGVEYQIGDDHELKDMEQNEKGVVTGVHQGQ